jgi:hypothetical protein
MKKLPIAISLQEFILSKCSSLQELPRSIGQLNALQEFNLSLCSSSQELHTLIGQLNALQELNLSCVQAYENFLHPLVNCMHSKTFICGVFKVAKITCVYWPITCTPKPSIMHVFEVPRITYI